jgi:hypothetical protein
MEKATLLELLGDMWLGTLWLRYFTRWLPPPWRILVDIGLTRKAAELGPPHCRHR